MERNYLFMRAESLFCLQLVACCCRLLQHELEQGILKEIHLQDFKMCHNFTFIWNKGSVFTEQYKVICEELQK